uniref:DMT family transporter n=1 Tax=Ramlibacter sp. TaxID=1917967 RepID=UPI0018445A52
APPSDMRSPVRLAGLAIALAGLVLVVYDSLAAARFGAVGLLFALGALVSISAGTLMQKRLDQAPAVVLPLQYAVSLALCAAIVPLFPVQVQWTAGLAGSVFCMGVVISVVATLLLYRLIRAGNLVNVTSLFYLVPGGTALLDYLVFGNRMAPLALAGLAAIVVGLVQVFRTPAAARA